MLPSTNVCSSYVMEVRSTRIMNYKLLDIKPKKHRNSKFKESNIVSFKVCFGGHDVDLFWLVMDGCDFVVLFVVICDVLDEDNDRI